MGATPEPVESVRVALPMARRRYALSLSLLGVSAPESM